MKLNLSPVILKDKFGIFSFKQTTVEALN